MGVHPEVGVQEQSSQLALQLGRLLVHNGLELEEGKQGPVVLEEADKGTVDLSLIAKPPTQWNSFLEQEPNELIGNRICDLKNAAI